MYTSYTKTILCRGLIVMASVVSYSFAETGTSLSGSLTTSNGSSLTNLSKSRHDNLIQKLTTLEDSLRMGTGKGADYRDMVNVLQCLQIPFVDGDQTSMSLVTQMSQDIESDRQSIDHDIPELLTLPDTDVRVSLMKQRIESTLQQYATMIDTIALSTDANRVQSLQSIDRIIGNNKILLNQLLIDKRLVDTMISISTNRTQKMGMRKTSLGFTQSQMDRIIADYRTQMSTTMSLGLDKRIASLSRTYKDIIPFADYIQAEKVKFLNDYQGQINDRFAQRLGDPSTGSSSYIQRLNETVALMQQQFYQSGSLQCGLLTTMTPLQRSNYKSIVADLNQSIATLPLSTTVNTSSSTSGSTITSVSLSSGFVASLNEFYARSYNAGLSSFTLSVKNKASLRKKAIRAEKMQLNALQSDLVKYRQTVGLNQKKSIKESLLSSFTQMEDQGILSHNTEKTIEAITKELNTKK